MKKHKSEFQSTVHNPIEIEPICPNAAGGFGRRGFLWLLAGLAFALILTFKEQVLKFARLLQGASSSESVKVAGAMTQSASDKAFVSTTRNLGVEKDGTSLVYLARGGLPEQNMKKILEAMGGIGSIIDKDDVVILKPNSQWWNQGMTNTNAMKAFMEEILAIPGFKGEIIIADNHQYAEPNSRGWTTDQRNGDFNYNELIAFFQDQDYKNVTKYHWRCAGPNPNPIEGDDQLGSKIVEGPWDGDGYMWRRDIVYESSLGRRCLLTYPIFTSAYSGVTIDFKDGVWKDGDYTGQPVKFINFSAINHHGPYVGVTASVKNYMGIVDMTCGFQATTPKGYYNTHFIGLRDLQLPFQNKLPWRVQDWVNRYNWKYFEHTGGVLGTFMREIRIADMNFITAHWVGYGSRIKRKLSSIPKALIASKDPVALDYAACEQILKKITVAKTKSKYLMRLNSAADKEGPFFRFLKECNSEKIGDLNPINHRLHRI